MIISVDERSYFSCDPNVTNEEEGDVGDVVVSSWF